MNKKIIGGIGVVVVAVVIVGSTLFKQNGSTTTSLSKTNSNSVNLTSYTMNQVSSHSSSASCWMVISGQVYDVTSYIPVHPNAQILDGCGKDATDMFNSVGKHMGRASSMLSDYLIGTLSN